MTVSDFIRTNGYYDIHNLKPDVVRGFRFITLAGLIAVIDEETNTCVKEIAYDEI